MSVVSTNQLFLSSSSTKVTWNSTLKSVAKLVKKISIYGVVKAPRGEGETVISFAVMSGSWLSEFMAEARLAKLVRS